MDLPVQLNRNVYMRKRVRKPALSTMISCKIQTYGIIIGIFLLLALLDYNYWIVISFKPKKNIEEF